MLLNIKAPFTRYNLLSNRFDRLSNRFDNRVNFYIHDTTGCQTRCQPVVQPDLTRAVRSTRLSHRVCQTGLSNTVWQPVERTAVHSPVCQTVCQTRLTTGWMFVCTIQPVVKPVVQLDWQPVVSCKRGFTVKRSVSSMGKPLPFNGYCGGPTTH